jgi:multiple antibiotic resistance protein
VRPGGVILFTVALDMIRGQRTTQEALGEMKEGEEADDVAVAPLAIPMLAGPAALSTVAVLMAQAKDTAELVLAGIGVQFILNGLKAAVLIPQAAG